MHVEVRATSLRAMRQKRGLTQRQLADDIGVSQNYIPAIMANDRQAGSTSSCTILAARSKAYSKSY